MIVGVDIGTQSLKALVLDEELKVRGRGSSPYDYATPQPGWAEQDPALWLEALCPAIGAALTDAGVAPRDIRAIGLAGQLDGCVAVDATGAALTPALIWMDKRAHGQLPALDASDFLEITGQVADPSHMAAKIRWLRTSGVTAARFHQPVSFVLEALCGEAVFDLGHASSTMLFDQRRRDYSNSLLEAFEIDRQSLPRIAPATEIAGTLSAAGAERCGLKPGTPLAVGTGDDFATPLGAGISAPGVLCCVLGTAEVVGAVSETRVLDHRQLLETHNYVSDLYFVENPGWLAGGTLRWLKQILAVGGAGELDALAASSTPGAGGVTFLPALAGAMAPQWRPNARGCFYGLSAASTRGDLVRAVLEGCAFAVRDVASRLEELEHPASELALLGGGGASSIWAQTHADVTGLVVRCSREVETCALGAALLAAVATGVHDSITAAANRVADWDRSYEPTAELDAAYQRYRDLFSGLETLF